MSRGKISGDLAGHDVGRPSQSKNWEPYLDLKTCDPTRNKGHRRGPPPISVSGKGFKLDPDVTSFSCLTQSRDAISFLIYL